MFACLSRKNCRPQPRRRVLMIFSAWGVVLFWSLVSVMHLYQLGFSKVLKLTTQHPPLVSLFDPTLNHIAPHTS